MPAPRTLPTRGRTLLLATALLGLPVTATACGAGLGAETENIVSSADGAVATLGDLQLRYVYLNNGRLSGYVYNDGDQADQIVSVKVADNEPTDVGTTLPPQQLTGLGADGPAVDVGVSDLLDGTTVPVTLSFQSAGDITLQAPVQIEVSRGDRQQPATGEGGE